MSPPAFLFSRQLRFPEDMGASGCAHHVELGWRRRHPGGIYPWNGFLYKLGPRFSLSGALKTFYLSSADLNSFPILYFNASKVLLHTHSRSRKRSCQIPSFVQLHTSTHSWLLPDAYLLKQRFIDRVELWKCYPGALSSIVASLSAACVTGLPPCPRTMTALLTRLQFENLQVTYSPKVCSLQFPR